MLMVVRHHCGYHHSWKSPVDTATTDQETVAGSETTASTAVRNADTEMLD
jgi:hypothetical protein